MLLEYVEPSGVEYVEPPTWEHVEPSAWDNVTQSLFAEYTEPSDCDDREQSGKGIAWGLLQKSAAVPCSSLRTTQA